MSLITLTFQDNKITKADSIGKGKVKVIKTEKFFGTEGVCVIGKLVDGAVSTNMHISGIDAKVKSVESNFGLDSCIREGAQVVLMVDGIAKDSYSHGDEIEFEKAVEVRARPQGRMIIA